MKHSLTSFLFLILVSISWTANSQENPGRNLDSLFSGRGEVYFKCTMNDPGDVHQLTRIVSIDNVKGNILFAYANRREFTEFLKFGLGYTILPHPGSLLTEASLNPNGTIDNLQSITAWDFYPTYDQYVSFMTGFAAANPSICRLDTVGTTTQGRLLLAVRISDNIDVDEGEPQFLYTSSIHGDETTGYILMLHLIDYLLSNYGTNPAVTDMVNNTQIFINPLANPDGTYHGGNNTVSGAVRYNANSIDLNRNFPDPKLGPHPDGNAYQAETMAWMDYADRYHFTMSANFHGGAEVFNYPWDTWAKLNADDDWWQFVGREYADTVHVYGPSGYFNDLMNGITNGYAWYELNGGRQDYMNYWHNCREVTIEISNIKLMPASQLENYWNYNYRSFLNYIRESGYGFNGTVTDTVTDAPIAAKVFIAMHDKDFSEVYSRLPSGYYARPIYEGTWNVTFSAPGYFTKTIKDVQVSKRTATPLDVQLKPLTYDLQDHVVNSLLVYPNPSNGNFRMILPENPVNPSCSIQVIGTMGKVMYTSDIQPVAGMQYVEISLPQLPDGLYFLKFNSGYRVYLDKLIIRK